MSSSDVAGAVLRRSGPVLLRARRAALVRRIKVIAASVGATVDVDVALDARIARRVHVEVSPGTHSRLLLGPEVVVGEGVVLQLSGGAIELGGWTELRPDVVLKSGGTLRLGEACTIGAGSHLHCSTDMVLGDRVGFGEYVSAVDSSHRHTEPGRPMFWDSVPGFVRVSHDVFVGAKATLTRSADIGAYSIVGANSVVVGAVPPRTLVSGVPAKPVRALELPWE